MPSQFSPVTVESLREARRAEGLPAAPAGAVETALSGVDQAAIFAEEEAALVVEEWDHQTSINGVSPAKIYEHRNDVTPRSTVYLLKDAGTGRVVVFQPFRPHLQGFQPIRDAAVEGADHRAEIAGERARARVAELVNRVIDGA